MGEQSAREKAGENSSSNRAGNCLAWRSGWRRRRQKFQDAREGGLVAEEVLALNIFAVAANLGEEVTDLNVEIAQVVAPHAVAEVLEIAGVEPLLELPCDGEGEHRLAQKERLAHEGVAAVGQNPGGA